MKFLGFVAALLLSVTLQAANKVVVLSKSNTLVMDKEFTPESVAELSVKARAMDAALPEGEAINLIMNTPGGSIFAGLELIENLNALNRRVDTITIFSASMGFQTVQHLRGARYITGNGTLMSHKARGGFEGEFPGQLDSRYNYVLSVVTEMDRTAAARSGKHTLASYQSLIENEYWCGPADCLRQGFVDARVDVKCDKSLSGTHDENLAVISFFGMEINVIGTMADCPTTTTPLDIKVKPSSGETEEKFVSRLTAAQRQQLLAFKTKIGTEYSAKAKKVIYTKIK